LGRAIRWYRKASIENDKFDKFLNIWQGLEALNPALKKLWKIPDEYGKCKNCGASYKKQVAAGIRELIQNHLENGEEIWREVRDWRVALVHSTDTPIEMGKDVEIYIPKLEEALVKGILALVGVPEKEWESWLLPPLRSSSLQLKVKVLLQEPDVYKFLDK